MTARIPLALVFIGALATALAAHEKVQNPAVLAWMDLMVKIADNTKIMGEMAKGERPFDAGTAQEAAANIALDASRIAELFETPQTDPHSEALPAIWEDFSDFAQQATALEAAARAAEAAATLPDLQNGMTGIARTCLDCHESYRQKN